MNYLYTYDIYVYMYVCICTMYVYVYAYKWLTVNILYMRFEVKKCTNFSSFKYLLLLTEQNSLS